MSQGIESSHDLMRSDLQGSANNEPLKSSRRIALIATPRSGNTWIRRQISKLYGLSELAFHHLSDKQWEALPQECIVQIHVRHTPYLADLLNRLGFRVVSISRHPLDVMISILHFATWTSETSRWLEGEEIFSTSKSASLSNEQSIFGAMPRSRPFLNYIQSERAKSLFEVTSSWWEKPGVVQIRYEDLVIHQQSTLESIVKALGVIRHHSIAKVIEMTGFNEMRTESVNDHFWKGQPFYWKKFFTTSEISELAPSLSKYINLLHYDLDANPDLTTLQADSNWISYFGIELHAALQELVSRRSREKDFAKRISA